MSTRARPPKLAADRGRIPYRLDADQVLRMAEAGILGDGEDVELWDGVLYRMVKGEYHNYIVSQVADAFRRSVPPGHHVREEKSAAFGEHSLPEPDVAICRGNKGDFLPRPPHLARLALVVEVDHHTSRADSVDKARRYAEVGIPVYWIVEGDARVVRVHRDPTGAGTSARYAVEGLSRIGDDLAIEVDGREVGRVAVAELFPAG